MLARLTGDVHAIETLLLSAVGELVQAAARLLFFAGALFLLSWKLALASLIVVPVFYFAAHRFARLARRAARERRRRSGSLTAVAEEALANAALVQAANAQEHELARFRRENEGTIARRAGRHAHRRAVRAGDRPDRAGRRGAHHRARHAGR